MKQEIITLVYIYQWYIYIYYIYIHIHIYIYIYGIHNGIYLYTYLYIYFYILYIQIKKNYRKTKINTSEKFIDKTVPTEVITKTGEFVLKNNLVKFNSRFYE